MLLDKGEKQRLINESKHTLPPHCLTSSPSLPPPCCLFFLFLAHQQFLTDLGKGRQLYTAGVWGCQCQILCFSPFFSAALGASLLDRLADDMPGWAEALTSTFPQGAAPDGVCSRS